MKTTNRLRAYPADIQEIQHRIARYQLQNIRKTSADIIHELLQKTKVKK